jgi:hypothetical protein
VRRERDSADQSLPLKVVRKGILPRAWPPIVDDRGLPKGASGSTKARAKAL